MNPHFVQLSQPSGLGQRVCVPRPGFKVCGGTQAGFRDGVCLGQGLRCVWVHRQGLGTGCA